MKAYKKMQTANSVSKSSDDLLLNLAENKLQTVVSSWIILVLRYRLYALT